MNLSEIFHLTKKSLSSLLMFIFFKEVIPSLFIHFDSESA